MSDNKPTSEELVSMIFESGIYANFYKDNSDWGNIVRGKYYDSPHEAERNIDWEQPNKEYLFTGKVTDKIFVFKKKNV